LMLQFVFKKYILMYYELTHNVLWINTKNGKELHIHRSFNNISTNINSVSQCE
jgi:hypothetical protein